MIDENHIRGLAERHTYEYKGVRYSVELWRMRFGSLADMGAVEPRSVDLDFTATPLPGGEAIRFGLHMGLENVADDTYLLDAIDGTIRKIVDGKLPPGTRSLL